MNTTPTTTTSSRHAPDRPHDPQQETRAAVIGSPESTSGATAVSARINVAFYLVVLGVALTGAGQAATAWLHWWTPFAFAAVAAVELGGVALSVHADERRRLGERALGARLLSALVAAGAVLSNFFGHRVHPGSACFFAGMSALGYAVWIIHTGARRRDQLRALGKLQHTAPAYGLLTWLRHPAITTHARNLALADHTLGTLSSIAAARGARNAQRQRTAIATVLHRKLRSTLDPAAADIAVAVYDLDHIAERLRTGADYTGLTTLIATDLDPVNLVPATPTNRTPGADTRQQLTDTGQRPGAALTTLSANTAPTKASPAPRSTPAAPTSSSSAATKPGHTSPQTSAAATPRRAFAITRQAATSLEAAGMDTAQIAIALGITPRQVRKALQPSA